jgi:hypothetical protein
MRGARGLYYLSIAELVWSVINTFSWIALTRFDSGVIQNWIRITGFISLSFSVAFLIAVIPFAQGRRGTRAEGVSQLLLALVAVNLLFELVQAVPEFGGPTLLHLQRPFSAVLTALWLAESACFFIALIRSSPGPIGFASIYWTLFALAGALSLFQSAVDFETYRQWVIGPAGIAIRWVSFGCSIAKQIMVIVILKRLMGGGESPAAVKPPSTVSAGREILIGSIFLLGGLAVTLISYSSAANGGRYVVASGAIAFGLVRLIRGLVRISGG